MDHEYEWVIFEALGKKVFAGRYFFENGLHRLDVPIPGEENKFRTHRFGEGAVYCITSVTEESARAVAARCYVPDPVPWDVVRDIEKQVKANLMLQLPAPDDDGDYEEDYDDDYDDSDETANPQD
jgi:hypothetical protein